MYSTKSLLLLFMINKLLASSNGINRNLLISNDHFDLNTSILNNIRGGSKTHKKTKKGKKQKLKAKENKKMLADAMKGSDSGKILGDAIRERKDVLLKDSSLQEEPSCEKIDASLASVSFSLGCSTTFDSMKDHPPSTIKAYFLNSHGGTYIFQCIMSLLTSIFACVCILSQNYVQLFCMRRALQCTFFKHVSSFISASILSARHISDIGFHEALKRVQENFSSRDPVAQYLFYTGLLLIWIPRGKKEMSSYPWYLQHKGSTFCLLAPLLFREVINLIWIMADILFLLDDDPQSNHRFISLVKSMLFKPAHSIMNLLFLPSNWMSSNQLDRQKLLAKLVSRISLCFEIMTSLLIFMDSAITVWQWTISFTSTDFLKLGKNSICLYLYFQFLIRRKQKMTDLVQSLRGGATSFSHRVLDILLLPRKSMGWDIDQQNIHSTSAIISDIIGL